MESEVKEKAKQLRIQNYYKSKNGKLNTTSFYSVKEKQPPRLIRQIQNNNQDIPDPDEIVGHEEWYENLKRQQAVHRFKPKHYQQCWKTYKWTFHKSAQSWYSQSSKV
jgi:hypothetical protein